MTDFSIVSLSDEVHSLEMPKYDWKCSISTLSWQVERGKEPNYFHRFMQRWLLGIIWERKQ